MALVPRMANLAANLAADQVCALLNNGYLRIYDGTQPATADTAITTQVLLAELRWNATAFAAASSGSAIANAITDDSSADASGTATWFRALESDGTTVVFDGSVGVSGCNINLVTTSISSGGVVSISSFTYTQSKS